MAHAWRLAAYKEGWIVLEHESFVVHASQLFLSFTQLRLQHTSRRVPDPTNILGKITLTLRTYSCSMSH